MPQAAEAYIRLMRAIELEGPETVSAIITEPILMSAGVVMPPDSYLRALREVCDEHDMLLIFDVVITGFGRTGRWFAAEHAGAWPDIFCCGKGVTGGYSPLSIVFMTERVAEPFWGAPGRQLMAGHTYGGNPVACAARWQRSSTCRRTTSSGRRNGAARTCAIACATWPSAIRRSNWCVVGGC